MSHPTHDTSDTALDLAHVSNTLQLQRLVTEQLLLRALHLQDDANTAEVKRQSAAFLNAEGHRVARSLDEGETLAAMERMSLPYIGAWCVVDLLDGDGTMRRLSVLHPEPARKALLVELADRWVPHTDDGFGLPAVQRSVSPVLIATTTGVEAALARSARDPDVAHVLGQLEMGSLLTVPLVIADRLVGAVTFVGTKEGQRFTSADIDMAEDLASRSAMALDRARQYGEAVTLRRKAEAANIAKGGFLDRMGHELRTPLNAIGGYVDLIALGIHGPVSDELQVALGRISSNQRYLLVLINDLLNFAKVGSGTMSFAVVDVPVEKVLSDSVNLIAPLLAEKRLLCKDIECDESLAMRGDRNKIVQILVNLLSNSIKFTPPGGCVMLTCEASETTVAVRVRDTGIGIPPDKLESIFEPFVQVKAGATKTEAGVGLGLAISRELARAMQGDLVAESALGEGACFILTMPRSPIVRHPVTDAQ